MKLSSSSMSSRISITIPCRASMEGSNLYRVLSLDSNNVSFDAIRRAYRSLVLRYHPDVCPPSKREEATRTFVELHKAYETLSDPIMRMEYDNQLSLASFRGAERRRFSEQVWRNQLNELAVRSTKRMRKKKKKKISGGMQGSICE